jgi:putative tricarboxylic transport membrane protein
MTTYFVSAFFGTVIGLYVGLLPGAGAILAVTLMYGYLIGVDWLAAVIFYATMLSSSQFTGSVSALILGLLGETTSQPVLSERNSIIQFNQLKTALIHTALGSVLAAIIGIIILMPSSWMFATFGIYVLRSEVLFVFSVAVLLLAVGWGRNKFSINIVLVFLGTVLGLVGYHQRINDTVLTFGIEQLFSGIPIFPIVVGLIAIPSLVNIFNFRRLPANATDRHTEYIKFPIAAGVRGSLIGSVIGLIPFIGTQISSIFAWIIEKKISPRSTPTDVLKRLTVAESSNNAASVTVLIPLLSLGVGISHSELLLLEILNQKLWSVSQIQISDWAILSIALLFCFTVSYVLCTKYVVKFVNIVIDNNRFITLISLILVLASVWYVALLHSMLPIYLLSLIVFSSIGLSFKNIDFTPLILAFLIESFLSSSAIRISQLYFF